MRKPRAKKVCTSCGIEKEAAAFYLSKDAYLSSKCRPCHNKESIKWMKANPEKTKETARKVKLKKKYGISVEEYNKMLEEQEGRCFLCEKTHSRRMLNVDHCHTSGKIRRLLCDRCNMAMGLIKDDAALANKMAGYINAFS